ncbi:hypothetical protein D9M71_704640 [compost metagenome]
MRSRKFWSVRMKKGPSSMGPFFIRELSVAAIFAATGAGLVDADTGELREQGFELLPDPFGEDFAGGVFQAGDLIEVVVVELLVERLEDGLEFGEVADPAGIGIGLTLDIDGHAEGVAVQAAALVAGRHVREPVRGFEDEFLEDFH